jgi:hypothetical protein
MKSRLVHALTERVRGVGAKSLRSGKLDLRWFEVVLLLEDGAHFLQRFALLKIEPGDQTAFLLPFFRTVGYGCAFGAALCDLC